MQRYVTVHKPLGQTPLECLEQWRKQQQETYQNVPITYAGRLDPLATGKLLLLIGDECKHKEKYLTLDKQYHINVLFGVHSDTGDALGRITSHPIPTTVTNTNLTTVLRSLRGTITLPYPVYSAKPVAGKPLHTWAAEGRLAEIEIPTKTSTIYNLQLTNLQTSVATALYQTVIKNIATITPVTDARKALGNDFRRDAILTDWKQWHAKNTNTYQIATITCTVSSGTYMRTLASVIAQKLGTAGLAFSIDRSTIGTYQPLPFGTGFWRKTY